MLNISFVHLSKHKRTSVVVIRTESDGWWLWLICNGDYKPLTFIYGQCCTKNQTASAFTLLWLLVFVQQRKCDVLLLCFIFMMQPVTRMKQHDCNSVTSSHVWPRSPASSEQPANLFRTQTEIHKHRGHWGHAGSFVTIYFPPFFLPLNFPAICFKLVLFTALPKVRAAQLDSCSSKDAPASYKWFFLHCLISSRLSPATVFRVPLWFDCWIR